MNLKGTIEVARQSLKKPLVSAIAGFIAGLIIGLPILGWGLIPVNWEDAAPEHLREDVKVDFLSMTIESYAANQDSLVALNRWKELGPDAADLFTQVQSDKNLKAKDIAAFAQFVGVDASAAPVVDNSTEQAVQAQPVTEVTVIVSSEQENPAVVVDETKPSEKAKFKPVVLLSLLCLLLLLVGGALLYLLVLRKKKGNLQETKRHVNDEVQQVKETPRVAVATENETPIARFMTTFVIGDDLYDDSFSIDSPNGEFLGECGVGISETIGVGEPKKVTALEIWLFDKNDIQTITKVLMSDYSFNDPVVSQRVVSKGEPIMLEQDKVILLETATLQLEARVVHLTYGQSALPDNSYFDRITMDLSIWPKA